MTDLKLLELDLFFLCATIFFSSMEYRLSLTDLCTSQFWVNVAFLNWKLNQVLMPNTIENELWENKELGYENVIRVIRNEIQASSEPNAASFVAGICQQVLRSITTWEDMMENSVASTSTARKSYFDPFKQHRAKHGQRITEYIHRFAKHSPQLSCKVWWTWAGQNLYWEYDPKIVTRRAFGEPWHHTICPLLKKTIVSIAK